MNEKNNNDLEKRVRNIEKDVRYLKNDMRTIRDYYILGDTDKTIDIISKGISSSSRKAKILLLCFDKARTQKQICDELNLLKGDVSVLIKELEESRLIDPPEKIGRLKYIRTSYLCEKNLLKKAIEKSLDKKIAKEIIDELG